MRYKLTQNKTNFKVEKPKRDWVIIDCKNIIIGRLAAFVANLVRGKLSADYTPNALSGYNIILVNCMHAKFSGKKTKNKIYYSHTGYAGGFQEKNVRQVLESDDGCNLLRLAIKRMLGDGPLAYKMLNSSIKFYPDDKGSELHVAQNPRLINFASLNKKNSL